MRVFWKFAIFQVIVVIGQARRCKQRLGEFREAYWIIIIIVGDDNLNAY